MIPQKLKLRNFMSYREDVPILDFAGIHVACLSGENGAGKSALLDAITWSLWGKARISSDDELIAQGQEEMEVDFEFTIGTMLYRVLRRRSSAKRGQTVLDLQVAESGTWRTISGNTIRETQALINDVLRMEYDTFVNSAFLVQGKADEFTRKTPADRKRVLAEILNLDEYERLEARAKEHAKALSEQIQGKEGLIQEYRQQVERRDFLLEMEQNARQRTEQLSSDVVAFQATFDTAQTQLRELETRREERDSHQMRLGGLQKELNDAQVEHAGLLKELESAHEMVTREAEIQAGVEQLNAAKAELVRLDGLYEQAIDIRDRKRDIQSKLELEEQRITNQLAQKQAEVKRHQTLVDQRPDVVQKRESVQQRLAAFDHLAAELAQTRQRRNELETKQNQLSLLLVSQEKLLGQIAVAKDSLIAARADQERRVAEIDALLRNEERWREELATATAQQRTLQRDERRLSELRTQDQAATLNVGELQAKTAAYKTQGEEINEKLQLLDHSGDTTCPLCRSDIGHNGIDHIREQYTVEREQLRQAFRDADSDTRALQRDMESRRREIYGLERKLEELKTITGKVARLEHDLRDAEEQRARRAEAEATRLDLDARINSDDFAHPERVELDHVMGDIAAFELQPAELEQQRNAVGTRMTALETELSQRGSVEAEAAVLAERLAQIELATTQLSEATDQQLSLQVQLDTQDFAQPERKQLDELQTAMNTLGYGRSMHAQAREQVAELEPWAEQAQILREAQQHIASNERHAARLQQVIERQQADSLELQATVTRLTQQIQALPEVSRTVEAARLDLEKSRRSLAVAQQELGAAQEKVEHVTQLAEQLAEQEGLLASLFEERSVYQDLVQAFGKKGIQAMLIETAIPELEREANELLGRMTDNQMHMRFETMRATKKGDTSETLDIHIADAQGTRRYDLYSGGEAFRINFAIRIALSKMLARRAGASLQTLIIDEGFGSQDGRGRERLVEAINYIQDDFERILVITHIQELKDQFPIQIEITKTTDGSMWSLN